MAAQEPKTEMSLEELDQAFDAVGEPAPEDMPEEMPEEMPAEEVVEEDDAAMVDLAPLMETLGATEERAQMLYDAAQGLDKTQGKTPQELADMIANDFDVLMQLEMLAARGEGAPMEPVADETMPEMPGEEMMAPEGM